MSVPRRCSSINFGTYDDIRDCTERGSRQELLGRKDIFVQFYDSRKKRTTCSLHVSGNLVDGKYEKKFFFQVYGKRQNCYQSLIALENFTKLLSRSNSIRHAYPEHFELLSLKKLLLMVPILLYLMAGVNLSKMLEKA